MLPKPGLTGVLVVEPAHTSTTRGSRVGGLPTAGDEFSWPQCADHHAPMQFTAQFDLGDVLYLAFFCEADPYECASWNPDRGNNAVLVVPVSDNLAIVDAPTRIVPPPIDPMTLTLIECPADQLRPALLDARSHGVQAVGYWGGPAEWIQDDETPSGTTYFAQIFGFEPLDIFFDAAGYFFVSDDRTFGKTLWQT